jgi:hypothetical protein
MKTEIELKSTLLGMVLGSLLVLSIAAATSQRAPEGRFQLMGAESYIYKIDTATGQVWRTRNSSQDRTFMDPNIKGEPVQLEDAPAGTDKR